MKKPRPIRPDPYGEDLKIIDEIFAAADQGHPIAKKMVDFYLGNALKKNEIVFHAAAA